MTLYRLGWGAFAAGGTWTLVYHLAPALGIVWSPEVDVIGGFGHAAVFAASVILLFDFMRKRSR